MTVKLRTIGIAILLLLVLGAAGAGLVVYSGFYNIAATEQHTGPVFRLLDYAMRRSVKARVDSIEIPDLADRQRIRSGAGHYRAHCLQCHGAPGVAPDRLAFGMTPAPVNLVSTAREWKPDEIFWVVKNGIKMSGMPAWGMHMSDQDMWDIVAFVKTMTALSPKEYAALVSELPEQHARRPAQDAGRPPPNSGGDVAGASAAPATSAAPPPTTPIRASGEQSRRLGDIEAGRRAIQHYLCATCHQIPGIVGASRHVGPPLSGIANRKYIGGVIVNNPENMVRWLQHPQQIDPLSAMPDLGVTENHARDIADYLYTLEDIK